MIRTVLVLLGIFTCSVLNGQFSCVGLTTINVSYTGSPQGFTVPAGVSEVRISITGASGGTASAAANTAGGGATVFAYIDVVPGDVFRLLIGQKGINGDFEAGGGGSSAVYKNGTLIMVAGAGGGEDNTGNGGNGLAGTSGGNSPSDPAGGTDCVQSPNNGVGGTGGNGGNHGEFAAICSHGGGGGGGLNSAGVGNGSLNSGQPGGMGNINGTTGGLASADDGAGVNGGWGWSGGGGADDRESGGGGGYSGGGGGPESVAPGGGGSFIAAVGTNGITSSGSSNGVGTTTGADGFGIICSNPAITLPIKLESFTATALTTGVLIKWTSSSEINTSLFIIEKSFNGVDFLRIGQVTAAGGSRIEHYSYTDPSATSRKSYYRVKIVDADGTYSYSVIRFVDAGSITRKDLLLYPNPAVSTITVTIPHQGWQPSDTRIQVIDMTGKVVTEKIATGVQNDINVQTLPPGIYLVRAFNSRFSGSLMARFTK